jgi:flagellar biosynthesis/type III secretory pathway M-ring protein FliF/YscJ
VSTDQTFIIVLILIASAIFTFAAAKLFKGPIGHALARRIAGAQPEPDRDAEVAELRARVAELEERVDFTERVLLQQQERGQVSAGGEHA